LHFLQYLLIIAIYFFFFLNSAVVLQQRYFEPLVIPDSVQKKLDWMRQHFEGVRGSMRAKASAWFREVIVRVTPKERERLSEVEKLLLEAQTEMATTVALKDASGGYGAASLQNNRTVMRNHGFEIDNDQPPETFFQVVADTMLRAINTNREVLEIEPYTPEKSAVLVAELARVIFLFKDESHNRKGSGEKYYWHLIGTAMMLIQEMGFTSLRQLIAMLQHDTIEDIGGMTTENLFEHPIYDDGSIVALQTIMTESRVKFMTTIVDALSKLTHTTDETVDKGTLKTKTIKKLLSEASKQDMRIVICKIADRLYNMRTMQGMKAESQTKNARETLAVYAPLADALGFKDIANELLCLSLGYLGKEELIQSYEAQVQTRYTQKVLPVQRALERAGCEVIAKPIPFGMFLGRWLVVNRGRNMDETLTRLDSIDGFGINPEFPLHTLIVTFPDMDQTEKTWQIINGIIQAEGFYFYTTPHGNKESRAFPTKYGHLHFIFTTPQNALLKKRGYTPPGGETPQASYRVARRLLESLDPTEEQILPLSVRILTPKGDAYEFSGDATVLDYAMAIYPYFPILAVKAIVSPSLHFPGIEKKEIPLTAPLANFHGQIIQIVISQDDDIPASRLAILHFVQPGMPRSKIPPMMRRKIQKGRPAKDEIGNILKLDETTLQERGKQYCDDLCELFGEGDSTNLLDQLRRDGERDDDLFARIGHAKADPLQFFLEDRARGQKTNWQLTIPTNSDEAPFVDSIITQYQRRRGGEMAKRNPCDGSVTFTLDLDFSSEVSEENALLQGDSDQGARYRHDRLLELYKLALALYMRGAKVRLS
jgi:hypothetical protein